MKLRDSGMPPQDYWETLLDVPRILAAFGFGAGTGDVVELGCGYGTFSVPLARVIGGTVHAIDVDPAMVEHTRRRAQAAALANIRAALRDVTTEGFGVPVCSCDAVLLFNILHGEGPVALLRAAHACLRPDGCVAVIHWRSDVATPRGPTLDIRPRPAQITAWAAEAGLLPAGREFLLPPWHFGLKLHRAPASSA